MRNKDWVLGVTVGEAYRAYPHLSLRKHESPIEDRIVDVAVTMRFDDKHKTGSALDQNGKYLLSIQLYWFAWTEFHPDTSIWNRDDGSRHF